jgi:uncharacterized membrane protein YfcA
MTVGGLAGLTIAWAALVLFAAGFARGYSGFGFSAVVVAGMSLAVPPSTVVPLAVTLEIAASLVQARSVWSHVDWRLAFALLAGGFIGNPAGVALLELAPPEALKAGVYLFVLAVAAVLLLAPARPRNIGLAGWFAIGLAAGAVNGATALSGLVIVTAMTLSMTAPAAMRATLVAYFFMSDLYAAGLFAWRGLLDAQVLQLAAFGLPLVAVAILLGSRRFLAASDAGFRRATLLMLAAISLAGLAQIGLLR